MNYNRRRFIKNFTGFAAAIGSGTAGKTLSGMNINGMSSRTNDNGTMRPVETVFQPENIDIISRHVLAERDSLLYSLVL